MNNLNSFVNKPGYNVWNLFIYDFNSQNSSEDETEIIIFMYIRGGERKDESKPAQTKSTKNNI